MGVNDSLYKRFGVSSPDFAPLVAGQKAVGDSLKEALGGVDNLLKQAEDRYKETNTLNMQEYLKGQLKQAGLGADPVDKEAIKKQFGSLINMDQLDKTIAGETKQMEQEAVDLASRNALQALGQTNDPLQSREVFAQSLRDAGAKESLVATASQAFNDTNALRFQDNETQKLRQAESRTNSLFSEVAQRGIEAVGPAIEALIADLPEDQQASERRRLVKEFEEESTLTEGQRETISHYMDLQKTLEDRKVMERQKVVDSLEQKHAALQRTGIPDTAYALADKVIGAGLGESVPTAIADQVTNWVESWSSENDGAVVKRSFQDLIKNGVAAKDASAIMAQAYSEYYPGDSIFGNNLPPAAVEGMLARVEELGQNAKNRYALSDELSKARAAVSDTESKSQERLVNLRKRLRDAGKSTRMRVDGALTIDDTYQGYAGDSSASAPNPSKGKSAKNDAPYVIAGVDIGSHATQDIHEQNVQKIYDGMPAVQSADQIDQYIKSKAPDSPITGAMVDKYAKQYDVDPKLLVAMMQQDSSLGTAGKGVRTRNPGNVGNDDAGNEVTFDTWEEGVEAEAKWLSKNKVASGKAAPGKVDLLGDAVAKRVEENRKRLLGRPEATQHSAGTGLDLSKGYAVDPDTGQPAQTVTKGFGSFNFDFGQSEEAKNEKLKEVYETNVSNIQKALKTQKLPEKKKEELKRKLKESLLELKELSA